MVARLIHRFLARQFGRPSGSIGRLLIGPWLNRIARPMNRLAFEQLDVRPRDRVLEVGFGGGELLDYILAATDGEVAGIDISEAMVARVRRRFRREAERLRLFHASAEAIPLADGGFDKAVSVNSLYFWPDPAAAIAEFARVLRPGGRLVLCFEPPEELRKWPGHRFGFRLFAQEEVERHLNEAGFHVLAAVEGSGRKPDHFLCLSAERLPANG